MTLIDAEALYKHFAELEEEARNKYISTTNEIEKSWWSIILTERTAYKHDVADAPVIEPRRGHWIDAILPNDHGGFPVQVCDQCNTFFPLAYTGGGHNFCPNCGADMRQRDEQE